MPVIIKDDQWCFISNKKGKRGRLGLGIEGHRLMGYKVCLECSKIDLHPRSKKASLGFTL